MALVKSSECLQLGKNSYRLFLTLDNNLKISLRRDIQSNRELTHDEIMQVFNQHQQDIIIEAELIYDDNYYNFFTFNSFLCLPIV